MTSLIIAFAVMLLLVVAGLSWPLLRGTSTPIGRGQFDRAVYRDQLEEIDRDLARGVLDQSEAAAARLEVQRRLLGVRGDGEAKMSGQRSRSAALATSVLVAGSAFGLYLVLGAPELPDVPFVAQAQAQSASPHNAAVPDGQKPPAHGDYRAAAAKMREKLDAEPNNPDGWELYARTLSRIGDYQTSADAYRHAIDLGRKTPTVYTGYGEMLVIAAQGVVVPAARDAFKQAQLLDHGNQIARFYLSLADAQAGEARKAVDGWLSLAADVPNDDEMREELTRRVAEAARSGGFEAPKLPDGPTAAAKPEASGGPTDEQIAAASGMSQADRDKMVHSMIDQLAARLAKEPNDFAGWLKLGQAYAVQGETDKAVDAYDHASQLKPKDPTIKLEAVVVMLSPLKPTDPIPAKVITLLHEVSAMAPEAPEVLWYLGIVDARQGRTDQARKNWTLLLSELDDSSQDKKMVKDALSMLDKGINP